MLERLQPGIGDAHATEWRVRLPADDEDLMATCLACGADTFDLADLGEVHSAGRDVGQTPQ